MTKKAKLRVHVCPIGFEVDRIVKSAINLKAERVWLIVEENETKEKGKKFIKEVASTLKKSKIEVEYERVVRDDLFDNLRGILDILKREKDNHIHVNVSAGSKIQAIAGMMICMMFKEYKATPYYVEPEKYGKAPSHPQSSGVKDTFDLPNYVMQKPNAILIEALKIIKDRTKLNKKQLAKKAIEQGLIEPGGGDDEVDQGVYAKLDSRIIKPLSETWKYINIKKIGTNYQIELSDSGRDICKFLLDKNT